MFAFACGNSMAGESVSWLSPDVLILVGVGGLGALGVVLGGVLVVGLVMWSLA